MGYRLVIAEKPSVAQSIAKVIGADRKRDGYLEGSGYLVSWCFGHLVELCEPQEYDRKYEKWRKEDLPIVPDPFRYRVSEDTKKQFRKLKELMERDDVDGLRKRIAGSRLNVSGFPQWRTARSGTDSGI